MPTRDRITDLRRVPASELRANPKNWRRHPPEQSQALRSVLDQVGYAGALLARETSEGLELIDGHLRREIADDTPLPVLVVDLDDEEAALMLATLDPLGAMAATDEQALFDLLQDVMIPDAGLAAALEEMTGQAGPPIVAGDPEFVPPPPDQPSTKPGDVWTLGEHRLLCGDSTYEDQLAHLMDGKTASLIFTDPPYGINVTGKGGAAIHGDISFTAIPLMFNMLPAVLEPGRGWVYICGGQSNIPLYSRMFEQHFRQLPRIIVWDKGRTAVMRHNGYHSCYEFIFYSFLEGAGARWFAGRKSEDADDIWRVPLDLNQDRTHPTQKPVELPARAIRNSSERGDVVFDPFAGSGSTLIAAEQEGRAAYVVEMDPTFCDVIVARWEAFTGQKAVLSDRAGSDSPDPVTAASP